MLSFKNVASLFLLSAVFSLSAYSDYSLRNGGGVVVASAADSRDFEDPRNDWGPSSVAYGADRVSANVVSMFPEEGTRWNVSLPGGVFAQMTSLGNNRISMMAVAPNGNRRNFTVEFDPVSNKTFVTNVQTDDSAVLQGAPIDNNGVVTPALAYIIGTAR